MINHSRYGLSSLLGGETLLDERFLLLRCELGGGVLEVLVEDFL